MAIDANQLTEKDELIAKFYTVRAGLSVIAEETKKISDSEAKIKALEDTQKREKKKYDKDLKYFSDNREKCDNTLIDLKNKIDEAHGKLQEARESERTVLAKDPKDYGDFRVGFFIKWTIIIGIVLSIISELIAVTVVDNEEILPVISLVCFLVAAGFSLILSISDKKEGGKRIQNDILIRIGSEISQTERQLKKLNEAYQSEQERYSQLIEMPIEAQEKSIADISYQLTQLNSELNTQIIPSSTQRVKMIKTALQNEVESIITEDDWENVDLLIFYLNTGRADSLKEALLLVDQQRQTDQISNAIKAAATYIHNSIEQNTYKIAHLMHTCFSNLSAQIDRNHRESIQTMESSYSRIENSVGAFSAQVGREITSLNSTIENQSATIVEVEELNSALLRQSDRRSDELMHELRYNQKYWIK